LHPARPQFLLSARGDDEVTALGGFTDHERAEPVVYLAEDVETLARSDDPLLVVVSDRAVTTSQHRGQLEAEQLDALRVAAVRFEPAHRLLDRVGFGAVRVDADGAAFLIYHRVVLGGGVLGDPLGALAAVTLAVPVLDDLVVPIDAVAVPHAFGLGQLRLQRAVRTGMRGAHDLRGLPESSPTAHLVGCLPILLQLWDRQRLRADHGVQFAARVLHVQDGDHRDDEQHHAHDPHRLSTPGRATVTPTRSCRAACWSRPTRPGSHRPPRW